MTDNKLKHDLQTHTISMKSKFKLNLFIKAKYSKKATTFPLDSIAQ